MDRGGTAPTKPAQGSTEHMAQPIIPLIQAFQSIASWKAEKVKA